MAEQRFADPIAREADVSALSRSWRGSWSCAGSARRGRAAVSGPFFRADGAVHRLELGTGPPLRDPGAASKAVRGAARRSWRSPRSRLRLRHGSAVGAGHRAHRSGSRQGLAAMSTPKSSQHLIDRIAARIGGGAWRICRRTRIFRNTRWWRRRRSVRQPRIWPCTSRRSAVVAAVAAVRAAGTDRGHRAGAGWPARPVCWRRATHHVVQAEGPERIAMEWWRDDRGKMLTRDYFRVEAEAGCGSGFIATVFTTRRTEKAPSAALVYARTVCMSSEHNA